MSMHNSFSVSKTVMKEEPVECFICVEPCTAVCVFPCGHFVCYSCGLRIHCFTQGSCPVCRLHGKEPIITRRVSVQIEVYSPEEVALMMENAIHDRELQCYIDGSDLAFEMRKLYSNLCPIEGCWNNGRQDAFTEIRYLQQHLLMDHQLMYCDICLRNRPAFLCEQMLYSRRSLDQHIDGKCVFDSQSFTGHPECRFCKRGTRFYDGEALLKHMLQAHYSCDLCNRGQFIFTFYRNRDSLIQHFERHHKLCDHPDCSSVDPMARVFANDIELAVHKQRVHGVKSRVLFEAGVSDPHETTHVGDPASQHGDAPATGSNTNVIYITFDYNTHRQTVEMLPTKIHRQDNKHGSANNMKGRDNYRHTNRRDQYRNMEIYIPENNGLPSYFYRPIYLSVMNREVVAEGNSAWSNAKNTSFAKKNVKRNNNTTIDVSSNNNNNSTSINDNSFTSKERGRIDSNTNRLANTSPASEESQFHQLEQDEHAFGIHRTQIIHGRDKYEDESIRRDNEKRLSEIILRELTSPLILADFHDCTRNYMESKINTSAYYQCLSKFFKDTDVFREVFSLIVATVPNEDKRVALQELWKIKMAPEMQHMEKIRLENEEKAKQEAEWKALSTSGGKKNHRTANINKSNNNNNVVGRATKKGNAWFSQRITHPINSSTSSQSATNKNVTTGNDHNVEEDDMVHHRLGEWGAAHHAPQPQPPPLRVVANSRFENLLPPDTPAPFATESNTNEIKASNGTEENFPALPRRNARRVNTRKKPPTTSNAWFKR